jgi:hypothetical protein
MANVAACRQTAVSLGCGYLLGGALPSRRYVGQLLVRERFKKRAQSRWGRRERNPFSFFKAFLCATSVKKGKATPARCAAWASGY